MLERKTLTVNIKGMDSAVTFKGGEKLNSYESSTSDLKSTMKIKGKGFKKPVVKVKDENLFSL